MSNSAPTAKESDREISTIFAFRRASKWKRPLDVSHGTDTFQRNPFLPYNAACKSQAAVCRRLYLTIELFLHPLGASLHHIP